MTILERIKQLVAAEAGRRYPQLYDVDARRDFVLAVEEQVAQDLVAAAVRSVGVKFDRRRARRWLVEAARVEKERVP